MPKINRLAVHLMIVALFGLSQFGSLSTKAIVRAQTSYPMAAQAADANTGRWSNNGRYFVFQNSSIGDGVETTDPSWVEYDTVTNQITTSRLWPLQPSLTEAQKKEFQIPAGIAIFISPNKRFIVYTGERPVTWDTKRWGVPLYIADLQTGQYLMTDLSSASALVYSPFFDVHWSGDSNTLTVSTGVDGEGGPMAIFIYYITNLKQSIFNAKILTISDAVNPGPNVINGIQVGQEIVPFDNISAISYDGQKLLIDEPYNTLVWYPSNQAQDQAIPVAVGDVVTGMGFNSPDNSQMLLVTQKYIQKYDLVHNQSINVTDFASTISSLLSTQSTQSKLGTLRAWVAPDGKHVAIMTGIENTYDAYVSVLPINN